MQMRVISQNNHTASWAGEGIPRHYRKSAAGNQLPDAYLIIPSHLIKTDNKWGCVFKEHFKIQIPIIFPPQIT